jgi:nitrate reductase cytochrome c-type subunit
LAISIELEEEGKMKKPKLLVLVLVITLIFTACGYDNNDSTNDSMQAGPSTTTGATDSIVTSENTDQMPETEDEATTEPEPVEFPENYEDGVLYTTVTRGSTFEELYTSREAIEAVQNGQPIPSGTVITLLIYRDNVLSQYFVMEKRNDGGTHYPPELRNGEWEYQAFTANGTVDYEENINNCLSCHGNRERNDYVNTLDEMMNYELDDLTGLNDSNTEYRLGSSVMEDWDVNVITANQDNPLGNKKSDLVKVHDEGYELGDEEKAKKVKEILLTMYL